jgi:hypothetical protein
MRRSAGFALRAAFTPRSPLSRNNRHFPHNHVNRLLAFSQKLRFSQSMFDELHFNEPHLSVAPLDVRF